MTRKDWAAKPQLRAELLSLLNEPIVQQAFNTLRDHYLPKVPASILESGGALTEDQLRAASANHLVAAGFFAFPNALRRLAEEGGTGDILPELVPWAHYVPTEPEPQPTKKPRKNARHTS